MKTLRYLMAIGALLLAGATAFATTTWTTPSMSTKYVGVQAAVTSGTESAPTSSGDGISIENIGAYSVTVEMTSLDGGVFVNGDGQVTTGFYGGKLHAYLYSPVSGLWTRAPALDLDVTAGLTTQTWTGIAVTLRLGRVAYVPYQLGPGGKVRVTALRGS